uniref:Sad1 and UNC84 domain containing 1 n=1 Tax=Naja naja TaxID=35670 RepID=A0A8C6Y4V5_NAJNA
MDFSRLHMYNPPQCLPENTGYTYALSSSYSLTALEFETAHKLDPVFDSPRMSRRSLRLSAAGYGGAKDDGLFGSGGTYAGKKMFLVDLLGLKTICLFLGLDDDGDLKGGDTSSIQANGDIATLENQTELSNGYTCNDCSMLSERKEALTPCCITQLIDECALYSLLLPPQPAGDDCKGKIHLETYTTAHLQSSRSKRIARSMWHIFSYPGYFLLHVLQRMRTAGWLVTRKILSLLWLAVVAPGKAATRAFWWLGTGWYQLVTLISLLNVFLLTRSVSLWCWGSEDFLSLLPALNWTSLLRMPRWEDSVKRVAPEPHSGHAGHDMDEQSQSLLSKMKHLELELAHLKTELLSLQEVKSCCKTIDALHQKVDAQIKESIRVMFSAELEGDFPESLLQWLSSRFVTKTDLQVLLRDLEMQILRNITLQRSIANSKVTTEMVTNVVNEAGIVGITEAQAQVIVNNALRLYSQDKTGIVDFALESGGGSILSTRCSETYETKTALLSLFGIPLWYFSQSPRVVIQPDMYPGNCWAFKGSQGYLVIRLSMTIYPTSFCLEHIPKSLSPTGNITSAPKDFLVYGLENEHQEEGILLGQYTYDQDGEPLQMFPVSVAFQIVELRIFSNWGHAEYTCLYRFRVHGRTAE